MGFFRLSAREIMEPFFPARDRAFKGEVGCTTGREFGHGDNAIIILIRESNVVYRAVLPLLKALQDFIVDVFE